MISSVLLAGVLLFVEDAAGNLLFTFSKISSSPSSIHYFESKICFVNNLLSPEIRLSFLRLKLCGFKPMIEGIYKLMFAL